MSSLDWTEAPELARRKQLCVRLRADLLVSRQRYEGSSYTVIKDPIGLRFFRFDQYDAFVLELLDGRHTLEQVQEAFDENFAPRRMSLEQLEAFTESLMRSGLLLSSAPTAGQTHFENQRKQFWMKVLGRVTNILYIEIPLFDPDALLRHGLRWFGWLYRPTCVCAVLGFVLASALMIAFRWDAFLSRLPPAREFFSVNNFVLLWLVTGIVKTLHELSHGLSCKTQGGEVHDMGALLMCLTPCFYMNVTDAWAFPSKWRRMAVGAAGIYMEAILASIATWVWWHSLPGTHLAAVCLCVMTVCGINTLLLNGNPLLRFDGYYILADWLELPNLRERSNQAFTRFFAERCLGIEYPPEKPMALGRWVLFLAYAVASYLYSWFIMFWAIWGLSQFLRPYNLGSLSMLLAWFAALSRLGWPAYRIGKSIYDRGGRLPKMKPNRVAAVSAALAMVVLGVLFVPLPIGRIRQSALVQVDPEATDAVFTPLPGTLEAVRVRSGQRVEEGTVLAELRNRDVETRLEQARTELAIRTLRIRATRDRIADSPDVLEKSRLTIDLSQAEGERRSYAVEVAVNENLLREMTLRAPRAGVVMGAPRPEDIGKFWDAKTPICSVADPTRLRALLPVEPDEYRILRQDLAILSVLDVTLRVQGLEGRVWPGRIAMLPENEAKDIPEPLTVRGGGPIATAPKGAKDEYVPQSQNYLVGIEFLGAENDAICPGAMGQAKVHTRWRSCGWWLWHKFCLFFGAGI